MATPSRELSPDDLLTAVAVVQGALNSALDRDWTVAAGTLDWDCRQTLDHMVSGSVFYSGQVSNLATARLPVIRRRDSESSVEELVTTVGTVGRILASVLRAAPRDGRFFHPAGMADVAGYVGMACVEDLVHTFDITQGLGVEFQPPGELCDRVLRRLFPWIEDAGPDPWPTLCWTTGRISLPGRGDVEADWYWQCAPLDEWDGTVRKRPLPSSGR